MALSLFDGYHDAETRNAMVEFLMRRYFMSRQDAEAELHALNHIGLANVRSDMRDEKFAPSQE
jgi:hypothetical protein